MAFVLPKPDAAASVRQIYELARAVCRRRGEPSPRTCADASTAIERLRRTENGHPGPRLEDPDPSRWRLRACPWWQHLHPHPSSEAGSG